MLKPLSLGIDLGIKVLASVSVGKRSIVVPSLNKTPEVKRLEKKVKRADRSCSKKSNKKNDYAKTQNYLKAKARRDKLRRKLRNRRLDYTHKATTSLIALLPHTVVMEKLNISGMMKNKSLAKTIQEQSWYNFKAQIKYKAERIGIKFKEAGMFYPSSKTCSGCGNIKHDLSLSDRTYDCKKCGLVIDRDYNAALNLEKLA